MKRILLSSILLVLVWNTSFAWEISDNGVDGLDLDKKIPAKILKGEKKTYDRMIADFVPVNGYTFKEPPVTACLEHDKTKMIIIEDPSVRTKNGIGVGSTFNDLLGAFKVLSLNPVPPTFGNDEAVAYSKEMPNVKFYFKDVNAAKNGGKTIRVILFKE